MEDKKYYWIKLRTNFFSDIENPAIDFLMSQPNGAQYVVLYQMLLLKTANKHGHLSDSIGEVIIPYNPAKIARDTKYFDEDTVRVALDWYVKLGLVYKDQGNELVIVDVEKYVGSESATKAAVKKRNYREGQRIKNNSETAKVDMLVDKSKDNVVDTVGTKAGTKCPTEIRDKSIEYRDKSLEHRDIEIDNTILSSTAFKPEEECPPSTKENKQKKSASKAAPACYSDDPELDEAIKDFIESRKKLRKPMTDRAIQLLIARLNKIAPDDHIRQVDLINLAIRKGWLDVYPETEAVKRGGPSPSQTSDPITEFMRERGVGPFNNDQTGA